MTSNNTPENNLKTEENGETKKTEKKAKKGRSAKIVTAVIACVCVLFVLLIAYTYIQRKQGNGGAETADTGSSGGARRGSQSSRNAAAVRVTPVSTATIENSVVINGDVLPRNQVSIFPSMGGKLVEVRLGIGDRVGRGDVVAMIDPSRPGEVYSQSPVISTVSGTVLQSPYSVGDTVSTQSAVYVVGDLSGLRVETWVPERYVSSIRQGLGAQVRLEALPGEIFYAEIYEVSPVLDPASRTLRILLRFVDRSSAVVTASGETINFSRPGNRVKAGMFATVSLVTRTQVNVPVIPRVSVINTYGSWIVFVIDDDGIARRHEVELGIENEEFIEVLSGVNLGDRVVSAGQNFLSDGDPVRVLE